MEMKATVSRNQTSDNLMGSVRRACTAIGAAACIALSPGLAMAQVADATQVTDPDELRAMGFSPFARNVYISNALGQGQEGSTQVESTLQIEATPTTGTDYSAISAKEFFGRIDTTGTQWRYTGGPNCCTDLSRVGSELFADAQFEVPTGATLNFFRYWAYDNNAANLALFVFRVCQPAFAAGPPIVTTIVSTATGGAPGHTTGLASLNLLVNNQSCVYLARVRFDAASTTLALQKVRLQFTR
jgi:hypothetical protein